MTPPRKNQRPKSAPAVPKSIPARSRWRTTRSEMLDRLGEPTRLQIELVDRIILNLIEAEAALNEARKEPIQVGPRGQMVENPAYRIAARCESTALAIARQLGVLESVRGKDEEEEPKEQRVEDELAAIRKRKATA